MNRTISCLLTIVCVAGMASAQVHWDDEGGDGDWHTAANWVGDVLPGVGEQWVVGGGYTVNINADVDAGRMNIGWWGGGDGHVIINNSDVIASGGVGMGQGDANVTGQLTMNGGLLTVGAWGLFVGYQNGTGILNMNAGEIDCGNLMMRVGYGTWGASEVTKGYVYLHGGTIRAKGITMYDVSVADPGTQIGEMEVCGDGKLILNGDVVAEINDEIDVYGTIYGCGSTQVVAIYDAGTDKTTVQLYDPNVVDLVGTYVDAVPADLPNGNTVRASDGAASGWYDGPTTVWSSPHAPNWFAYSGDSGLSSEARAGIQLGYYSLNYYGEGGDPLPTLRTTITGLQDNGIYNVYVVYKSALVTDPCATPVPATEGVKAALTGEATAFYNNVNGTFVGPESPKADKSFFQALLGSTRAYGGEISVDVDVIGVAAGEETFYDGLTYELTEVLPLCEEIITQYGYPADVTGPDGTPDCSVDLFDFAALMSQWLRCVEPTDFNCEHPWID